jgi:hypothetical protein
MPRYAISRRRLLQLGAMLPVGALVAACSSNDDAQDANGLATTGATAATSTPEAATEAASLASTSTPTPPPTATPEPFIVPAGEVQSVLMPGTPYETPVYVYGTGMQGPIVAALGGVHGNEPGGWLAAERLVDQIRPSTGGLIVLPRANRLAINLFARTTEELGDLNRLYPGERDGLPMAQMAYEIIETLKAYHATHVIDMHESWSFYRDRTDTATGTAYLGQTVSTRGEPGESLARQIVETLNATRVQLAHEELTFREWPPSGGFPAGAGGTAQGTATPNPAFTASRGSRSSLGLPTYIPGLTAILVEMGQQQDLERRIQLHVDFVAETLRVLSA